MRACERTGEDRLGNRSSRRKNGEFRKAKAPHTLLLIVSIRIRVTSVPGGEYTAAPLFARARVLFCSKSLLCHLQHELCREKEKERKKEETPRHLSPYGVDEFAQSRFN